MKIEPTADMRYAAAQLYQMFLALVDAGFSEDQALDLVKAQMTAAMLHIANNDTEGEER